MTPDRRTERGRGRLAHQCRECGELWALREVDHPSGLVVLCTHCGAVHWREPRPRHLKVV